MRVKEAKEQVLAFLRNELRKRGERTAPNGEEVEPYIELWPNRSRSGIRVAELGFMTSHGGGAFMQSDMPHGLLVCAATERLLLDLCDEELDEAENSKWALTEAIWPNATAG